MPAYAGMIQNAPSMGVAAPAGSNQTVAQPVANPVNMMQGGLLAGQPVQAAFPQAGRAFTGGGLLPNSQQFSAGSPSSY